MEATRCNTCEYCQASPLYRGVCTKVEPNHIFTEEDRQKWFVQKQTPDWCPLEKEKMDDTLRRLQQMQEGLPDILRRFGETGCYSPENPNQNQDWCSCGKPFCYECVSNAIAMRVDKNLLTEGGKNQ